MEIGMVGVGIVDFSSVDGMSLVMVELGMLRVKMALKVCMIL